MSRNDTPVTKRVDRHLGECLRTWRVLNKVKQAHAAELLSISQPTVSRIEKGLLRPSPAERAAIFELLAARLTAAADHELARLVNTSKASVHIVCDLTHRLFAASPSRQSEFRVPVAELMGQSLWKFATEEFERLEEELPDLGWYDGAAPAITVSTRGCDYSEVTVPGGEFKYVRFRLANGSHARLIETTSYVSAMQP